MWQCLLAQHHECQPLRWSMASSIGQTLTNIPHTHSHNQSKNPLPVEVWAASDCVVAEVFLALFIAKVLQRIRPKQITHRPERRGLLKPVQLGHKDKNIIENTEIHLFPVAMHEISVLPHTAWQFMHGLAIPSLCRLKSGFPGTVHRGRTGTVGSWVRPRADSRTRPYRSHKPALNTWFYLKHSGGDRKWMNIKRKKIYMMCAKQPMVWVWRRGQLDLNVLDVLFLFLQLNTHTWQICKQF